MLNCYGDLRRAVLPPPTFVVCRRPLAGSGNDLADAVRRNSTATIDRVALRPIPPGG